MRGNARYVCLANLLIAPIAVAGLIDNETGDATQVPYVRSIVNLALNEGGANNGSFYATDGTIYDSNTTPTPSVSMDASETLNGATIHATGNTAYGGFYRAKNYVDMSISNAQHADGYYALAGQGTKTSVEFFAPVDAATVTYHWHVEGDLYQDAPYGVANSRLDFMASESENESWFDLFSNPDHLLAFGPGDFTYTIDSTLNVPISLFYWSSVYAQVNSGTAQTGTDADYIADFSDTYELDQIVLTDADGNVIHGWYMEDTESGAEVFNEFGRVESPEPASLTAIAALCLLRRRSARRRPPVADCRG